ncbi:MAG: SUMF1/EgtB/PvdO family nonheme iron enzyme [Robiginitomaculum sp.]
MSEWQPPQDGPNKDGFNPGEERAPLLRWVVGFLALAIVATGAIWLVTKVVISDDIPQIATTKTPEVKPGDEPESAPKKIKDDEAWVLALEKDTLEGYREYLEQFPKGKHASEAQAEINKYDNKAWVSAQSRNTIAGYEDYLEAWPEGLYASKARELIAEMKAKRDALAKDAAERGAQEVADWESAARSNTLDGYNKYLGKHPIGKHADEAQKRINKLKASAADQAAWEGAKAANTAAAYQQYLNSFPQGAYVAQAIAALDKLKPRPGKTFKDCADCPVMVSLPAGNTNLGAAQDDQLARSSEKPARPVIFTNLYAIGVNEITFKEWDACVSAGSCKTKPNDNGWGRGNRPVINISWDDARGYATWLSGKTGFAYSLPSEAQWEYAARGGDKGIWAGGSTAALCAFANGAGQESGLKWANTACTDIASDRTIPSGTLGANGFGTKDMIGNVSEWTLDCNTLNLRDAPTDGSADLRGSCNQRVARGGSWFSGPADLRFASRLMLRRGDRNDFTGFRLVRKIDN